jgi:hypothetical protein
MNEIPEQLGHTYKHCSKIRQKGCIKTFGDNPRCGMFKSKNTNDDFVTILNCSLIRRDYVLGKILFMQYLRF